MTKESIRERNLEDWQRLQQIIDDSGLTINAFARHIGLSRGENLYQIKRGHNGISRDLALRIHIFRNTASAGCSPASTTRRASSTPPTPAGYRSARTATENPFRTYVRKGFRIGPASVRTGFSSRRRKFRIPRAARPSAPAPTGSSRHARHSPRRKRSRCGACPGRRCRAPA